MIRDKRNKAYKMVALAATITVAGSCVAGCGTIGKETAQNEVKETTEIISEITSEEATEITTEVVVTETVSGVVEFTALEDENKDGWVSVCEEYGEYNAGYTFDFNQDGELEYMEIKSVALEEGEFPICKYNVYINGNNELELEGEDIVINIIDIDSSDSEYELVINSSHYDDIQGFGIYRYTGEGMVNLNEAIADNHISVETSGDGILVASLDDYNNHVGCFYLEMEYKYVDGKLVDMAENTIYDLLKASAEYEYKAYRELKVYSDYDLKEEVTTLEKGSTLTIGRIHQDGTRDYNGYEVTFFDAAEIIVDGEVAGWIELPEEVYEEDERMFDGMPAWD